MGLLREGEDASLCPSVYLVLIIYGITVSEQCVVELPGLPYFWEYFIKPCSFSILIFLSTESSSCINCPSLMSNCLLKILVIGSCVTFGEFLSKFLKCSFHSCICSSWLVAFSLAFTVLFLLLTSFTVCYAILDCLSSTKSLILLIWFYMYSLCSFKYMLINSFCFRALVLVGSYLLHLEALFTPACFFLTANVSHGILGLALCLVGMHSPAASKWALMKFSYLSLGVSVSFFSCIASNLILSVNAYPSLISLLLSREDQSLCTMVVVQVIFLPRLSHIFTVTIW